MKLTRKIGHRAMASACTMTLSLMAGLAALVTTPMASAGSLTPAQQEALHQAEVPVYPDASFMTGDDDGASMMLWFQSSDSSEKIMDWYREKLSSWSVVDANGMTIVYKGPPGLDIQQVSGKPYVYTRPYTATVPASTEITIGLPK